MLSFQKDGLGIGEKAIGTERCAQVLNLLAVSRLKLRHGETCLLDGCDVLRQVGVLHQQVQSQNLVLSVVDEKTFKGVENQRIRQSRISRPDRVCFGLGHATWVGAGLKRHHLAVEPEQRNTLVTTKQSVAEKFKTCLSIVGSDVPQ